MDHASGTVAPLDPELIQVGDAIGQRAQRRGLVQGSVRPAPAIRPHLAMLSGCPGQPGATAAPTGGGQ
jgi:hypothetical protein